MHKRRCAVSTRQTRSATAQQRACARLALGHAATRARRLAHCTLRFFSPLVASRPSNSTRRLPPAISGSFGSSTELTSRRAALWPALAVSLQAINLDRLARAAAPRSRAPVARESLDVPARPLSCAQRSGRLARLAMLHRARPLARAAHAVQPRRFARRGPPRTHRCTLRAIRPGRMPRSQMLRSPARVTVRAPHPRG